MRCVICHCEPVSAPSPLLPREPPSLGDLSGSGPGREGAGGGEVNLLIQYTMEKGIGDPATEPNTWMSPRSPPRQWAGEGGFKGSSFIPPPLPWGWPPAPSFPSSSPPRPGRDWRGCTQLGRGLGAVGGHPDLAAVQAAGGCTRCLGRLRGLQLGRGGGSRSVPGDTPWHGLAQLSLALPPSTAEEPPGEASGEGELQEHEAGLPCAHLPSSHIAAWPLLPYLPQR